MTDKATILLVNPPIYDFAAFDFWLKPLGLLTAAGNISNIADFQIFDFLDRSGDFYKDKAQFKSDDWGRGKFFSERIQKPAVFKNIPRYFRRFGLPSEIFTEFLQSTEPCDFAFIQTVMTYWYLGYQEVIKALRTYWPRTKIFLGGPYTKICPEHARSLGADFIYGEDNPAIVMAGLTKRPPLWELYGNPETVAMKITNGCPFKCTYCTVPVFCDGFTARPVKEATDELKYLIKLGVKNIAFYDDALLYKSDEILKPFLHYVIENKICVNFHTPNALNARFIDTELVELMVKAGFKSFYLGFESRMDKFQKETGAKIFDKEFAEAVKTLVAAGAEARSITAYLMLGHPRYEIQETEESMKFVHNLGIRIMLADFSPIPGTPDGEICRKYVDMDEPLMHSKTVFPIILFGNDKVNRIKDMCRELNGPECRNA
ncbi:MAG: radical SAM protein [Sedimentisphaerales bacterium]|nr:radical SAM protein [Sedimentisphaerales bacterium]